MLLRRIVFWLHLGTGVVAGTLILFMSATGVLLAFEPQLAAYFERDRRVVTPPAAGATRIGADAMLARAREARPDVRPNGVVVRSDPSAAAIVSFGREGALFVDPYTGAVLGGLSGFHEAMHEVVEWHRWLGSRDTLRPVTGAANAGFLGLAVAGLYLWWPRRRTPAAWKTATRVDWRLSGRARDFNWHNVVGFWCAPVLLVITLTGLVMSYPWANDLLFALTGNTAPPQVERAGRAGAVREGGAEGRSAESGRRRGDALRLDPLQARAEQHVPGWIAINLRLPQRPGEPVSAVIHEPGSWHPNPRSQLTLDPKIAEVLKWEPYAGQNLGRRLRSWVRPLHTGEAGGPLGQLVAMLASAGGGLLVWTGLALAWRRFRGWRGRAGRAAPAGESPGERAAAVGRGEAGAPGNLDRTSSVR